MAKTIKRVKRASRKVNVFRQKNKRLVYIVGAILLIAIAIGVVFTLNNLSSTDTTPSKNNSIKAVADSLKKQAIQNMHTEPAFAQTLLTDARQKYLQIGDQNNVIDVDSQLYLIEHTAKSK